MLDRGLIDTDFCSQVPGADRIDRCVRRIVMRPAIYPQQCCGGRIGTKTTVAEYWVDDYMTRFCEPRCAHPTLLSTARICCAWRHQAIHSSMLGERFLPVAVFLFWTLRHGDRPEHEPTVAHTSMSVWICAILRCPSAVVNVAGSSAPCSNTLVFA